MTRTFRVVLAAIILAVAIAGYYLRQQNLMGGPAVAPVPPPVAETAPPPVAAPAPEPAERYPIAEAPAPLPGLERSDEAIGKALRDLLGERGAALLVADGLIRRIVATVDNLPRPQLPLRLRPLRPVPQAFATAGGEGDLKIAPTNAARYEPYVELFEALDTGRLVAIYRHFYPLFQQAYRELGYPKGHFNDRLVEAIDDLLAAPEPPGPVRLLQPKVLYQFADPDLEARSAGQKILIRMGLANEAIVKAKLREIRSQVTAAATRGG